MKKVTLIKMEGCPYCRNAFRAIDALKEEKPAYHHLELEVIDENEQPELAGRYAADYYYVPSLFVDGKKCYEAQPGQDYETIKNAVDKVFSLALE